MRLIILLCASIVYGCATLPPQQTQKTSPSEPKAGQAVYPQLTARQDMLASLSQWSLSARLSIRHQSDAWAGQMRWLQKPSMYLININAPMGQGAMQLRSNPQFGVEMKLADGKITYADDPQSLLYDFTGWQIPMAGLKYWVQGIPTEAMIEKITFDEDGRLSELHQGEWQIVYRSYRQVGQSFMPRKLILQKGALKILLVVDHWDLGEPLVQSMSPKP